MRIAGKTLGLVGLLTIVFAGVGIVVWFWFGKDAGVSIPSFELWWPRDGEATGEMPHLIVVLRAGPDGCFQLEENRSIQVELFQERPQRGKANWYGEPYGTWLNEPRFLGPNQSFRQGIVFYEGDIELSADGVVERVQRVMPDFRSKVEHGVFKYVEVSSVRNRRTNVADWDGPQRQFLARFLLVPFKPGVDLPLTAAGKAP